MFENLKKYCLSILPLTLAELNLLDDYFYVASLKKKEYLLETGTICKFIAFIDHGTIRHFHVKDGVEKTCDLSIENSWVTDFQSFTHGTSSLISLQAMEETEVHIIDKEDLFKLYSVSNKFETFGRIMAEQVAMRATDIAMSLSSEKPEERFKKLLENQADLFQRVPQKHIANFLGISPESLSRIRKRVLEKSKS